MEDICCICLDELTKEYEYNYINTKCCFKNIHKKCLFSMLISKKDIINSIHDNCPLCRVQYTYTDLISLEDILEFKIHNKKTYFILKKYYNYNYVKTITNRIEIKEFHNTIKKPNFFRQILNYVKNKI